MNRRVLGITALTVAVAALTLGGPAIARSVADFARNAGHVDGIKAVTSQKCGRQQTPLSSPDCSSRANKLVAANKKGYLPNDIIRVAPDAAQLGGESASRYAQECGGAAISGFAQVPADVASDWAEVEGYGFVHGYGGPINKDTGKPSIDTCQANAVKARHVAVGVYEVSFFGSAACQYGNPQPGFTIPAVATVNDPRALTISYTTRPECDPQQGLVQEVRIFDSNGASTDAGFTMTILKSATILYP
ncbi:MAG: hypothetical protein QOC87_1379 [Actinomycetota bacterium]|jgi:hypothetical protein|nr:hypothetical protein [Actinomycetota bacterium]